MSPTQVVEIDFIYEIKKVEFKKKCKFVIFLGKLGPIWKSAWEHVDWGAQCFEHCVWHQRAQLTPNKTSKIPTPVRTTLTNSDPNQLISIDKPKLFWKSSKSRSISTMEWSCFLLFSYESLKIYIMIVLMRNISTKTSYVPQRFNSEKSAVDVKKLKIRLLIVKRSFF